LGSSHMSYRLTVILFHHVPRLAGQPTFVFVMVNEGLRYFAASVSTLV
jgi:hypothetical protein